MEPVHIPRLEITVEVEAGKPEQRTLVFTGDVLRIGSHGSNDLVLIDPMVSRFHCEISRGPSGLRLIDNRSLNGTRLGEHRVRDADLAMPRSRISLGESVVVVRDAEAMVKHDWPGNVRELKNFVERRVVFEESDIGLEGDGLRPRRLAPSSFPPPPIDLDKPFRVAKGEVVDAFERQYLSALLEWAEGNVSLAARKAKIDRMHLHRLLQLHGLREIGSLTD